MDSETVQLRTPNGAEATIYPGKGFNLIGLRLLRGDRLVDVIHAEPDVLDGGSPTRSGMPILFPFPNRIAGGSFDWAGRSYAVPVTHPGDVNAIHGFVCRAPWGDFRVTGSSATGTFRLSRDAPQSLQFWPGDLELLIRYDLSDSALTIETSVSNTDEVQVPFGLGFHAYLTPRGAGSSPDAVAQSRLWVDAEDYWVLQDSIPTGERRPVSGERDLRDRPQIGSRVLDDVLTGLPHRQAEDDGLIPRAELTGDGTTVRLLCDENWRDIVVFTPGNRESVAIEPYTCPTDAVHLDERGLDVGWQVLEPGAQWRARVRLSLE